MTGWTYNIWLRRPMQLITYISIILHKTMLLCDIRERCTPIRIVWLVKEF